VTRHFRSTQTAPFARGQEFGTIHAAQIRSNIATYQRMFDTLAGSSFDMKPAGAQALAATAEFAPPLHEEIQGLAEGAGVDAPVIGALNARTEILALLKAGTRGECSAVIHVPPESGAPVAVQTWDWNYALKDSWLHWDIPLADGSITRTMTEYGILGKAGMNTRGLGLLFTILHHEADGARIGVPVHIAARWTLDSAPNIAAAAQLLAGADVSASSSINLVSLEGGVAAAITVELNPAGAGFVLPDDRGYLIHTNHFLAPSPAARDTEPGAFPDTLLRHNHLKRWMSRVDRPTVADVLKAMASHSGGMGAVCSHRDPAADPGLQYETLSTVILSLETGNLTVHPGGPCTLHESAVAKSSTPFVARLG
jgi:isopenicillin-N N-acyltransferase-like protein